jgi:hypothetical protein
MCRWGSFGYLNIYFYLNNYLETTTTKKLKSGGGWIEYAAAIIIAAKYSLNPTVATF